MIYFVIMIQETPVENVKISMPNEYFRHHSVSYRDILSCMRAQLLWPLVLILWEIIYTEFIGHTILSCQRASQYSSLFLACLPRLSILTLSIVSLAWLLPSTVALDSVDCLLRLISSTASLDSFRRLPLLTHFVDCLSWLISSTASLDSFRRLSLLTHSVDCLSWLIPSTASLNSFRRLPLFPHFVDCLSWLIPSTAFLDSFRRLPPSNSSVDSFHRLPPSTHSVDWYPRPTCLTIIESLTIIYSFIVTWSHFFQYYDQIHNMSIIQNAI